VPNPPSPEDIELQVIAKAEGDFLKASQLCREAKYLYEMGKARVRMELKAESTTEGKRHSAEDISSLVQLAHQKEPLMKLWLDYIGRMGDRDGQEVRFNDLNRQYWKNKGGK
jgi:hypothetical protein